MQETLNQLAELNNDAIAESTRTAQLLTTDHDQLSTDQNQLPHPTHFLMD
jgi:hypothetical protein